MFCSEHLMSLHNNLSPWERFYCKHLSSCPISEQLCLVSRVLPFSTCFLYFTEGMSYHTFAWILLFGCTISSGGSTLGGATALGINEVQRVECTQTWGVNVKNVIFCQQLDWIGYLLPRHPRSRGSAWSSACAQPMWDGIKVFFISVLSRADVLGKIMYVITCLFVMIFSLFLKK